MQFRNQTERKERNTGFKQNETKQKQNKSKLLLYFEFSLNIIRLLYETFSRKSELAFAQKRTSVDHNNYQSNLVEEDINLNACLTLNCI